MKVVTRKMMAKRRNKFPIQRQQNVLKSACPGWKRQNDVDPVQVMQLHRMMDFTMRSRYKTLKQTTMLHFFRNDEQVFIYKQGT